MAKGCVEEKGTPKGGPREEGRRQVWRSQRRSRGPRADDTKDNAVISLDGESLASRRKMPTAETWRTI